MSIQGFGDNFSINQPSGREAVNESGDTSTPSPPPSAGDSTTSEDYAQNAQSIDTAKISPDARTVIDAAVKKQPPDISMRNTGSLQETSPRDFKRLALMHLVRSIHIIN